MPVRGSEKGQKKREKKPNQTKLHWECFRIVTVTSVKSLSFMRFVDNHRAGEISGAFCGGVYDGGLPQRVLESVNLNVVGSFQLPSCEKLRVRNVCQHWFTQEAGR